MVCNGKILENKAMGMLYMLHGSMYIIPYVLCMVVMHKQTMRQYSCYKIMIAMGYVDLTNTFIGCVICGFMSYAGLEFCPHSFYIGKAVGAVAVSVWITYCALCVTLALNRYMQTIGKGDKYFGGAKVWRWLVGCFVYGGFMVVYYFSPYGGVVFNAENGQFVHTSQSSLVPTLLNNILLPFVMLSIYIMIIIKHYQLRSLNEGEQNQGTDDSLRRIMITSVWVSFIACSCAVSYLIVPPFFSEKYPFLMTLAQIWWQFCHGSNCIIYLSVNKSMRQGVKALLFGGSSTVEPTARTTLPVAQRAQNAGDMECKSL